MSDCLFCKIITGEVPGSIVYRDDRVVAFKDINAQAPLHALIVPVRHISTLNALTAEDDGLVGEMVRRAAAIAAGEGHGEAGEGVGGAAAIAAEQGYGGSGYRTVFNTNAGAGQSVFHIHLHVLAGR